MKRMALFLAMLLFSSINAMPQNFKEFYKFYDEKLKQHGIIGSSYLMIKDNKIIDQRSYGMANLEKNQRVDAATIFHWASITKTFNAIAIMQLRDRGLLKLDDPVTKYLPELKQVNNQFGSMDEITIRQLLSHSAGFQGATFPWGGDKEWHPFEPQKWEQLVAMMPYTRIEFKPGSKYSYSNPAFIYLGKIIEMLSKDDFEIYIDKNIFRPLEMHRSYFDSTPYHLLKHRSAGYWLYEGKLNPSRFDADTGITVSNGGLNAPLGDMAKYLNFLIGDSKMKDIYDGILKRSSLEEMWQPQVKIEPEGNDGEGRKDSMGLSFFIEENFGQNFIGHSGGQNGFISHFYLRPDSHSAYIVAYNTHAIPSDNNKSQDTRLLDREIKEYLFKNVFPILAKK